MAKIKITQKRSVIGRSARQKATMDALVQNLCLLFWVVFGFP